MEKQESDPLLERKDKRGSEKHCGCFARDRRPKCIEFASFLYFLAQTGSIPLVEQFVQSEVAARYDKLWSFLDFLNINYGNTTGQNLEENMCKPTDTNYTSPFASIIETSVQAQSSTWLLYFDLALTLPAIFSTLIICTASDKYGRKLGILLVSGMSALRMFIYILAISLELNPAFYLVANALEGLSGSSLTMIGSCLAYIVDTSSVQTRSMRFITFQSINVLSVAFSNVSTGFLITGLGFSKTFWLIALIHCINTIHIAITVPDSHPKEMITEQPKPPLKRRRSSLQAIKEETVKMTKKVFGSFSVFSQNYQQHSKLKLGLLLSAFLTNGIITLGSSAVVTLYMLASPFCWDSVLIGIYHAISAFTHGVVGMIVVWIFRNRLRDVTLAIIGSISIILSKLVFGLATNSFMLYLAIFVSAPSNVIFPLIRAMMSKIVGDERQGMLFAAVFGLETICDLVSGVLVNAIYTATVSIYPAIVFFISAGVYGTSTLFLCVYYYLEKTWAKGSDTHQL